MKRQKLLVIYLFHKSGSHTATPFPSILSPIPVFAPQSDTVIQHLHLDIWYDKTKPELLGVK